ncbi:hypothetical protein Pla163_37740 [Planctomycetes bacterium Pla163]|uniref:Nucleotidyl transferase AbiEii toxin, Type IV TA system n=1 Tax=Rohdeia mirabilis TaxID=2528008 RepID=A0A518D577_9BACT|nr:hypothetical protein Pla163_37740 [Planctomycetes bacterium Pla163]
MTHPADPNIAQLEAVAERLGGLLDEVVLVGGTAVGLLITDSAAESARATYDVDVIVEAASYVEYARIEARLCSLGFVQPGRASDPICRWKHGEKPDELTLDLMPLDENILGFSNPWYPSAFAHATPFELPSGRRLRHVDAPHFLATKLEAYAGRGQDDPLTSHDLEDLVRVVDGRPELLDEMRASRSDLRRAVGKNLAPVLADRYFVEALPGYFEDASVERSKRIIDVLEQLVAAGDRVTSTD